MIYQTGIKRIDQGYFAEVVVHVVEEEEDKDCWEDIAYNGDKENFEPGKLVCKDAHGNGQSELSDGGKGEEKNF
jgi:hypothetical protein